MRTIRLTAAILVLLGAAPLGQGPRPQDVELQAAQRTEAVDGRLDEAIDQYRAITTKYTSDRAVVATALVRMAGCYQKLGDAKARTIYERVVREFGDQQEAV